MNTRNKNRIKDFLQVPLCTWIFIAFFLCCWNIPLGWAQKKIHTIAPRPIVSHTSTAEPVSLPKPEPKSKPAPEPEETTPQKTDTNQEIIPSLIKSIQFTAPVTLCGEPVPIEKPHVRKALEKEMLLMLWDRAQIILWLKRGAYYFPHIEKILDKENMPRDMKYVSVIESSLIPHAESSAGATGFWQFMKGTGRKYGLVINSHIDQRRNIFDSTRAACAYMKELQTKFHSYATAFAAYNMGENGLARQIKTQETDDYYSLYLNTETRRYVYRIIAAKLILEDPKAYGFHLQESDFYPPLDVVSIHIKSSKRAPIMLIAKSAQETFLSIKTLNPQIRGYHFGPGKTRFFIPRGKEKGFKNRFARLYKEWERTAPQLSFHVVRRGDTLSGIAKKYKMSTKELLRLNNMNRKTTIHPGDKLKVK